MEGKPPLALWFSHTGIIAYPPHRIQYLFSTPNTPLYSEITTPEGYIFVYDYQDGKFGYNTSTTRGADTFHPFRNGGDEEVARSKLYAAMQYSGKVNSSMTFDYMCQILSEMFSPWDKYIFRLYSLRIYDKKVTLNGITKDEAGYGGKPRNIGGFGGFDRDKRKSFDSDSENRAVKTFLIWFL